MKRILLACYSDLARYQDQLQKLSLRAPEAQVLADFIGDLTSDLQDLETELETQSGEKQR